MKIKTLTKLKKPIIIYDDREEKSLVVKNLKKFEVILIKRRLDVGDYLVGEKFCVERKKGEDFVKSIIDGRIYRQLESILSVGFTPVIILENFENFLYLNSDYKRILTFSVDLITKYKGDIIFSRNSYDTAYTLYKLAKYEQEEEKRSVAIGFKKKSIKEKDIVKNILMCLPGIGNKKAEVILKNFKNLKEFFEAPIPKLLSLKLKSEEIKLIKKIYEKGF